MVIPISGNSEVVPRRTVSHSITKGITHVFSRASRGRNGRTGTISINIFTFERLNDKELYEKLDCDPDRDLSQELHDLWVHGKSSSPITAQEAKEVVFISDTLKLDGSGPPNRPSTLQMCKPGRPYF